VGSTVGTGSAGFTLSSGQTSSFPLSLENENGTPPSPFFRFTLNGNTGGDPHITGPGGQRFDFYGRTGETYMLFDMPQFAATMTMSDAPFAKHTINEVTVRFGGQAFSVSARSVPDLSQLKAVLASVGGTVAPPPGRHYNATPAQLRWNLGAAKLATLKNLTGTVTEQRLAISLCPGVSVSVIRKDIIAHTHNRFLDVVFSLARCADGAGGVVGQLYQCKYVANPPAHFEWHRSMEGRFHISRYRVEEVRLCCGSRAT
jgi:hypothetical protein